MPKPVPVHDQYTDEQKRQVSEWFHQGLTQAQIAEKLGCPRRTAMKLCQHLGLARSTKEAAQLSIKSPWDDPAVVEQVRRLRPTKSLPEISRETGIPVTSLQRLCRRHDIAVPSNYAALQAERMRNAWTPEKRVEIAHRSRQLVTSELRAALRAGSVRLWENPEYRAKQIATQRDYWGSPENRERLAQFRANQSGRVSSIQRILYGLLDDLKVEYTPEFVLGPYNFDCKIGNILIECQGDYWHSLEKAIRMDRAKAAYIAGLEQYSLHYLWEHEFACKDRVLETIKYWLGITKMGVVDFNRNDLEIKPAPASDYRPLLEKYHYLPNAGRGGKAFGAYLGDDLVAVCVFSPLVRQNIDTAEFSDDQVVELSRLCIHPKYQQRELASWFVSRCIKRLDRAIKAVISYCDTTFNHNGATYRACNFKQDKIIRPDYWYAAEDGWVMFKKNLYSKAVRMSLTEAEYAERFGYKRVYGSEKLRFIYRR